MVVCVCRLGAGWEGQDGSDRALPSAGGGVRSSWSVVCLRRWRVVGTGRHSEGIRCRRSFAVSGMCGKGQPDGCDGRRAREHARNLASRGSGGAEADPNVYIRPCEPGQERLRIQAPHERGRGQPGKGCRDCMNSDRSDPDVPGLAAPSERIDPRKAWAGAAGLLKPVWGPVSMLLAAVDDDAGSIDDPAMCRDGSAGQR